MELYFEQFGKHGPSVLVLHGLFGSASNWRTLAKGLADRFSVFVVDQRNHGRSPHAESMGYADLVADALGFLDRRGLVAVAVVGHSMGGKAAMTLALGHPDRVSRLVVVDIAPTRQSDGLRAVLDAMLAIDLRSCSSREDVDRKLAEFIPDAPLRQFLLTNVIRSPAGAFAWRINLCAIESQLSQLAGAIDSTHAYTGPTLFIRGGRSDHVRNLDRPTIEKLFPAAEILTIEGAGHWVHADAADAFIDAVAGFLSRPERSD